MEGDIYTMEGIEQLEDDQDYSAEELAFMRGYLES